MAYNNDRRDRRKEEVASEYIEKVVSLNRVSKTVKGGRVAKFSALCVVGDGKGRVGFGMGKANEVSEAIRKGLEDAKKNICTVTLRGTTIPHEVTRCSDASLPLGTEEVLTEGADGELLCTAEVTYINGEESSRRVLSETVTKMPTTEIIGVGAGPVVEKSDAPIISDGYITLPTGEVLTYTHSDTVRATAYTHTDQGCDTVTSTGTIVHWGTVAVDPRYIPYGTRMFIVASDGSYVYGIATAEDCGGDIKGDRMDLYMPTYEQCMEFGRRRCTLYFLG